MKLFYHRPDGHGPASFFVLAATADEAASAVNARRRAALAAPHPDTYYWQVAPEIEMLVNVGEHVRSNHPRITTISHNPSKAHGPDC